MTDEINGWMQIETTYSFQDEMWRNLGSGEVVSVEEMHTPLEPGRNFQVILLPENYQEDSEPINVIGSEISTPSDAREAARTYMRE